MTATNKKAIIRLRIQFILSHFNRVGHLMRKDEQLCKKDNLGCRNSFCMCNGDKALHLHTFEIQDRFAARFRYDTDV